MNRAKRLLVVLGVLALTLTFAPAASAHTIFTGGSCGVADARFYGNANGQPSDHYLRVCYGSNVLRLSAVTDGDGGNCAGFLGIDNGEWDNCITSVNISFYSVPQGVKLCLYLGDNWTASALVVQGSYVNWHLPAMWDDTISSMKWATSC